MTRLEWDKVGERVFETGVDRGVLYIPNEAGAYANGVPWNGLTTVTEKPSGAAATPFYADNIKYLNLIAAEEFGADVQAHTYPLEFAQFDGAVVLSGGVSLGQQSRRSFGLSYRTRVGNDVLGSDLGYKLHLVYGCQAAPTDRAYTSVNDKPEALAFSWTFTTTPVSVTNQKPTSLVTIDSTAVSADGLAALENILWGSAGSNPRLPFPDEIIGLFAGTLTLVTGGPTAPTYTSGTRTVTIPTTTGVVYTVNGVVRTTNYVIPVGEYAVVEARPASGYTFPTNTPYIDRWVFGPAT